MLTLKEVEAEALRIAREQFGAEQVKRTVVESDIDSEGKDSLSITIVLKSIGLLTGMRLGKTSLDLIDYTYRNGDDRYPYTHYATEKEMKELAARHD